MFKWKIKGSDLFEQSFYGRTMEDAIEHWSDFWNISMDDCEAFSFSINSSKVIFEVEHKK